jgi:hypothetical protein
MSHDGVIQPCLPCGVKAEQATEIDNLVDLFYCEPKTTSMTMPDFVSKQSARGASLSVQSLCCRPSR